MSPAQKQFVVKALTDALFWGRVEAFAGECETCDPGNEGAEIWGEINGSIRAAFEAIGEPVPDLAPWMKDTIARRKAARR